MTMMTMKEIVLTRDDLGDGEGETGTSTERRAWRMFLAALVAVLAAMLVSATQPQEANATTVGVTTCSGTTIQLTTDEKRTLDLHNQTRVANGLPRLCVHPALTNAACSHSQEMLTKGYFAHNSYNGERPSRLAWSASGTPPPVTLSGSTARTSTGVRAPPRARTARTSGG